MPERKAHLFRKSIFLLFVLALALTSSQASLAATNEDPIFSDDFESGNLLAWSAKKTDQGDLAVTWPAALEGAKGMRVRIDDQTPIYVTDDTPDSEVSYTAKFLFDPNSIQWLGNCEFHAIFLGEDLRTSFIKALRIDFGYCHSDFQLRARARKDDMKWKDTSWFNIANQPYEIKIEWHASEAEGMNNGQLMFVIDNVLQANITGIDNDTFQVDRARLGAMVRNDIYTGGTYFIDAFESFRGTSSGLLNP
jgi:hypothetical protein